jgi:syntaxin 1B/2/3
MAALRDELARLRSAPAPPQRGPRSSASSGRRAASAPASRPWTAGLRGRVTNLTADVQALRRQVSAERRDDAARRYLAVAGDAPIEEQLDRLLFAGDGPDAALLLSK